MATPSAVYTLGETPTIRIEHCDSDLAILGHAEPTVIVESSEMPHSVQREGQLVIEQCDDDLSLRVPYNTAITLHHVDGDFHAEHVARIEAHNVSGDVALHAISEACAIHNVDGDVHAHGISNLALDMVNGDLSVDDATGMLAVQDVEGDARLRGALAGFGPTHVSGDLSLDISFTAGAAYRARVDGDMKLHVPADADLTLEATVDGDVSGVEGSGRRDGVTATWGEGRARLSVSVSGDLNVRHHAAPSTHRSLAPSADVSVAQPTQNDIAAEESAPRPDDAVLAVLEALARGDITTAEADDLLTQRI